MYPRYLKKFIIFAQNFLSHNIYYKTEKKCKISKHKNYDISIKHRQFGNHRHLAAHTGRKYLRIGRKSAQE
jgi:hypothetical protein